MWVYYIWKRTRTFSSISMRLPHYASENYGILYTEIKYVCGGWRRRVLAGMFFFNWSMSLFFVVDQRKIAPLTVVDR